MDYKELNNVDLEFLLFSGRSIKTGNFEVSPYKLGEIAQYGYSRYMNSLQFISYTIDDFLNSIDDKNKKEYLQSQVSKLKTFDFYMKFGGHEMQEFLLSVVGMIFKTNDVRIIDDNIAINFLEQGILKINEHGQVEANEECTSDTSEENLLLVNRNNFDDIVKIIKLQNYLIKLEDNEPEFDLSKVDEATRQLLEQQKKMDEKVEKIKRKKLKQDEDGIDITDIIRAVSSKSYSINEINVWDLTIYQLYKKYATLEAIDNYDFSIKALMAGAKSETLSIKHWSSKL